MINLKYGDLRTNNRVQINMENPIPSLRQIQGLILKKETDKIILITVQGEIMEIRKTAILSITKINFGRVVSQKMVQLKKLYEEIISLEARTRVLKERTPSMISELQDANFINSFNIEGAKHRLEHSIEDKLLFFENRLIYEIAFDTLQNTHINVIIRISNKFKIGDDEKDFDIENLKKNYCPDEKNVLDKIFNYSTQVFLSEQEIVYQEDKDYIAYSTYIISVDINQDNFLRRRKEIRKSLFSLR